MRLREWIATFRSLHEKARRGLLTNAETTTYREAREELLAMLLAAQRLTLRPGETVREAPRAVRALPLEIHSTTDTVTLDISTGGFAALLSRPFRVGEQIEFSLWLSSGPLQGRARVASVFDQGGSFRISFRLENVSQADTERMEFEVLDAAMEQLEQHGGET